MFTFASSKIYWPVNAIAARTDYDMEEWRIIVGHLLYFRIYAFADGVRFAPFAFCFKAVVLLSLGNANVTSAVTAAIAALQSLEWSLTIGHVNCERKVSMIFTIYYMFGPIAIWNRLALCSAAPSEIDQNRTKWFDMTYISMRV